MRRLRFGLVVALIATVAAIAAGCGESDPDAAKTPANAPTITNGQPPVEGEGGGEGEAAEGDVAAGKTAFEASCQGCHAEGGTAAGSGPVLADRGLATDAIRNQIVNGGVAMPANLVSGADLDNVVAFVASLQGAAAEPAPKPAPTTETAPETSTTAPAEEEGDTAAIGAGKTFFEGSCQGCHPAGGTENGAGPKLAAAGLTEDGVRNQIVNGGTSMPAGLASGDDLENVIKFLLSLQ